ncbi:MAG: 2-C-methyl-D-erythritol 4-phosphate cytidylyltransferase [Dehalococcoidia bacterium]|nr:2-C-methyl-D-erythritol 4-phosphate cytidylyltransferase [Dehalococcoidia bacterium]
MPAARIGAIIVAAGRSERMGGQDKVFATLLGRPLVSYSIAAFDTAAEIDEIALVVAPTRLKEAQHLIAQYRPATPCACVPGGKRRRDSVLAGLNALPGCEWVLVHDGARPLVTPSLIGAALARARETGAAVPGIALADTVKRISADGHVAETLDRATLRAIQTPQAFRRELLLRAHEAETEQDALDDGQMVERLGIPVVIFPGDRRNLKVTTAEDLIMVESLLQRGYG